MDTFWLGYYSIIKYIQIGPFLRELFFCEPFTRIARENDNIIETTAIDKK